MPVDKSERKYHRLARLARELQYERDLSNAKDVKLLRLECKVVRLEQEVARLEREIILQEVFG